MGVAVRLRVSTLKISTIALLGNCLLLTSCGDEGEPAGPLIHSPDRPTTHPEEPLESLDDAEGPDARDGSVAPMPDERPPGRPWNPRPRDHGESADDAGAPPTGSNEFDVEPTCTSGEYWMGGYSERMHPGGTCIGCHGGSGRAPKFQIAGTVFPTAHEPNGCNAENPAGVRVEITGADGRVQLLGVNDVGNFMSQAAVALPYKARVLSGGRARDMLGAQSSGDCNSCHTQDGAHGAPGRILLP